MPHVVPVLFWGVFDIFTASEFDDCEGVEDILGKDILACANFAADILERRRENSKTCQNSASRLFNI